MQLNLKRRALLSALAASPLLSSCVTQAAVTPGIKRGHLKQSVMPSVWGDLQLSLQERCEILSMLGFAGMDLAQPEDIPVLQDHGLVSTMMVGTGTTFENGFIRPELHDQIEEETIKGIDMCVEAGCPTLIGLAGVRRGMSREEAADNTTEILSRVAPYAEAKGINLCMEITNSKVAKDNRTDQPFDDIEWGFDICRRIDSPNIKVVYDFYHVQIANGDVTRTLRENLDLVCHIHVAGVPNRAEIDDNQELNYRFIAQEIVDMGYEGYVAHEYNPSLGRNPIISLATAFDILTV